MFKKLIGTKAFYRKVIMLTIPIMVQNFITNFVNMLDNIMVGRAGETQMTGVAVSNQLIFVFNLCIFGAISAAGIFSAQYYGKGDNKGIADTFRFKILCCTLLTVLGILLFTFGGEFLISFYLKGEATAVAVAETMTAAKNYLYVMLIGLIPYAVSQCYSSTLRETGRPVLPMVAGIIAVVVNLVFNWLLIFGKLGLPRLGVVGAAVATVLSRFVELLIVVIATHTTKASSPFIIGVYKTFKIPFDLVKRVTVKGLPLMINETMWAAGMAVINQCYSERGLSVVTATNITQTFFNVFGVGFMALGVAVGILMGQTLGSKKRDNAMNEAYQSIVFSVLVSAVISAVYFVCAAFIPRVYNIDPEVMRLATTLMRINALAMPIDALAHASYFIIRSGGRVIETVLFDCGYEWIFTVPLAFVLSRYTAIGIIVLYAICQFSKIIKSTIGVILVKKGIWVKNIVDN